MTIAAVRTHVLEHVLDTPFESASMRFDRRQHCLVEIETADGRVGWGECLGPAGPNVGQVAFYAAALLGRDAMAIEPIWRDLYNRSRDQGQRGLALTALSGIDIALWDLKGQALGRPVSDLLGGRFRDSVRAYATGGFRRDGRDPATDFAEETGRYAAEGFHAVKIKIGFDVAEDLRVIKAVREAIGPETRLMIDANHGYDVLEACELGRAAAEHGVDWFEEPVIPEQLGAYQRVRAGQPIPVAGGETWQGRFAHFEALRAGAVDILQSDVCGVGGLSEMRRVVDLAGIHGVRVVPHVWGTGIALAAGLHALATQPPEPDRRAPLAPILEFDRTPNPFRQGILTAPIEHQKGVVAVPTGPGLGIEIDRAALESFRIDLREFRA